MSTGAPTPTQPPARGPLASPWLRALALAALCFAFYAPVAECGFVWDDDAYVQRNETLGSWDGLRRIWFELDATPQYYPMVHTTFWVEHALWGLAPAGYHLVNVGLHALAAILLWRGLARLGAPGAWTAAALFALHPVHVESVAWITERKNVLSAVFYLAAALAYLRWEGLERARRPGLYLAALGLFVLALFSKTVTASLPAALLVALWWKRGRIRRADVLPLAPFFAAGIAFGLMTVWIEKHHVGAEGAEWELSLVERVLVAGRALWFYASKLAVPSRLTFLYPRWTIDAGTWWQYLYPAGFVALVAVLWLARQRVGRGPLAATLFFAGTLFPALGFLDVFPFLYSFVADHFQYLASIGPLALAAGALWTLAPRIGRPVAAGVASLALVLLGALTWRQVPVYRDLETLWRDTLRKNPGAWLASNNLGNLLLLRGELDEAIFHYERAVADNPDYAPAHSNLCHALTEAARPDEALEHGRRAVELEPGLADARHNYGNALLRAGRPEAALLQYEALLEWAPDSARAHGNAGVALRMLGRLDEALAHFEAVARIPPESALERFNLAITLLVLGRTDEATRELEAALRLDPEHLEANRELAWLLATHPDASRRDPPRALAVAQRAAGLAPDGDLPASCTLAAALGANARYAEAARLAEATLERSPASGPFVERLRRALTAFRAERPYLEAPPAPRPGR